MTEIIGAKLITAAYVFGIGAIVFAVCPFLFVVIKGILKSRDPSVSGTNVFSLALLAFIVHFVSCIGFMVVIKGLDLLNRFEPNLIQQKIFSIFWAESKAEVLNLAQTTESIEVNAAYTTLFAVRTATDLMFLCLPILVIVVSFAYGISQSHKEAYRQNYLGTMGFTAVSFVVAWLLYLVFTFMASYALFLPEGNLLERIHNGWNAILQI